MMRDMVAALLSTVLVAAGPTGGTAEQVVARTESSTTVVTSDGTRTITLYTGPVQLRSGAEWVPMDLTLAAGPDGVARPLAAPHDLQLTPTGPVVAFLGGGSAALDWTTPLPAPRLEGNRATYPQARPGYDLVVEATSAGFVASLRRAGAAPGPVAPLTLRRSTEGPPDTEGSLTEAESAVSRVVAAAPPTGTVPFDTTVQSTVLRTDSSGDPDLRLGTYDGAAVARSYLTFDLAELTGKTVTSARLQVHQDWSASCRPRPWEIWSSPAVGPATRWTNQPAAERMWASSAETRGHDPACAAGWTTVDVTELARTWAAGGAPSGTVQLRASDEADPLGWKRFGSAEGVTVPHLDVQLG